MATKFSANQLAKFKNKAEGLMRRAQAAKGKTETIVGTVVHSAEVGVAAFAMGAINGRYGGVEIAGVPADLAGALALHAVGFTGMAGKQGHHVHALADGLLASYATTLGKGVGTTWKEKALKGGSAVRGARLTEKELKELAGEGASVRGSSEIPEREEEPESRDA